jgi:formamidopyrimidine-DNA glycosylase
MSGPLFENINNRYGIYQDLFESEISPVKIAKEITDKSKKNIFKKTGNLLKKIGKKTEHSAEHAAHKAMHHSNHDNKD